MHFFIRESAPKHVPLIFAASVCATCGWRQEMHVFVLGVATGDGEVLQAVLRRALQDGWIGVGDVILNLAPQT